MGIIQTAAGRAGGPSADNDAIKSAGSILGGANALADNKMNLLLFRERRPAGQSAVRRAGKKFRMAVGPDEPRRRLARWNRKNLRADRNGAAYSGRRANICAHKGGPLRPPPPLNKWNALGIVGGRRRHSVAAGRNGAVASLKWLLKVA
jgi:hypothetical protein